MRFIQLVLFSVLVGCAVKAATDTDTDTSSDSDSDVSAP